MALINLCMLASTVDACQYMCNNCLVLLTLGVVAIGVRTCASIFVKAKNYQS